MKYWKQGFYDEPQGGAIEITEEYYEELFNGQSNGFSIGEDSDGYPILIAPFVDYKQRKIDEITVYDKGDDVNRFFINDNSFWFDKNERASLVNLVNATEVSGENSVKLWTSEPLLIVFNVEVERMKHILVEVESYAKRCYDVTQEHKATVYAMADRDEIENYDFKTGYPDKLRFEI